MWQIKNKIKNIIFECSILWERVNVFGIWIRGIIRRWKVFPENNTVEGIGYS